MPISAPVDKPLAGSMGVAGTAATGAGVEVASGAGVDVAVPTGAGFDAAGVGEATGAGPDRPALVAGRCATGVGVGRTVGVGVAVAAGVGTLAVGVGVGRKGATIGPEVGVGAGVGRAEGGRLNVTGGVVCGAALFDCAAAPTDHSAGSVAAVASHTPARLKTVRPFMPITL